MIHVGDCLDILPTLEPGSVQCCVTSPPYFGLRDYGVEGQHGSEESPEAFVANLVEVFRRVRTVLRDDGTLWLNLGDSYNSIGGGYDDHGATSTISGSARQATVKGKRRYGAGGMKPKDLMGMPWAVAFALRADGWFLRQEIIWSKPNPMPESITDRCTKSHEHIFLLAKSPKYYFNQEAILEPCSPNTHARLAQDVEAQMGSDRVPGKTNGRMKAVARQPNGVGWGYDKGEERAVGRKLAAPGSGIKSNSSYDAAMRQQPEKRNKRSVWTVTTQPFKEAHFATFPPALIEPCILAGSRPGDLVLDPYMGAGTTAVVCERLGRRWIGCELNRDYAEIAERRIRSTQPGLPLESVLA